MTGWEIVRLLHLLAMAFFVGGQLVLVAAVVPVMRGEANRDQLRAIARRFGIGSAVAFGVLLITGSMMAGHYELWSDSKLHLKLGLVALTIALIGWHTRRPQQHWLEGLVFLLSLAIVWLGVSLAH
jgi:putative copper export protein